ncbi:MAG: hypothetical protein JWM28_3658 [Chitinophagaceae bacterium]|nr:hypothetical protein [Chitinophagaceae bacterium]
MKNQNNKGKNFHLSLSLPKWIFLEPIFGRLETFGRNMVLSNWICFEVQNFKAFAF